MLPAPRRCPFWRCSLPLGDASALHLESKNLDCSTWVSENLYKIITILLLIVTVVALFFLRNVGDTAALLCFQKQARDLERIEFPHINWNSITPISDKTSRYANFRSEQWIVVSVSNYPTDSLRNLVKIKGWQVLAVENTKTPSDWSLKGAIFLSLEEQANLGFRVVDYLPYDSYVRKTVGYLFVAVFRIHTHHFNYKHLFFLTSKSNIQS